MRTDLPEVFMTEEQNLTLVNQVASGLWAGYTGPSPKYKNPMTAYERTTIKSLMNIEYGSGASMEQLCMAYGYFGSVAEFIEKKGYEIPSQLIEARDASKRDLDLRIKQSREKEISSIKAELETLQSAEEKREKLYKKLAKLEEQVK